MAKRSFEAAIADLERTNGPPEEILTKAADILGLNLQEYLETCCTEVRFKTTSQSPGFKERWLLRWLLKNLNTSDPKGGAPKTVRNNAQKFVSLPQFWALLLAVTSRITDEVCLEILLERKFFHALDESIKLCLTPEQSGSASQISSPADLDPKERPSKKRRLSPPAPKEQTGPSHRTKLIWPLLQAACRCVGLLAVTSSQRQRRVAPTWTASWSDQASLLGGLLDAVAFLLRNASQAAEQVLLSQLLSTALSFWKGDNTAVRTQTDDPNQAFASHCLEPVLVILDFLRKAHLNNKELVSSKTTMERLVAMHVVFPFRAIFNERYAKKWRNVHDVLLYDHLESMLKGFRERIMVLGDGLARTPNRTISATQRNLSWMILDIAVRSVPASDLRKRQQEQPWLDSLFICVIHLLWPHIPQVTATGAVHQDVSNNPAPGNRESWVAALEKLVDVALALKLKVSLSVLGYVLSGMFAVDEETCPWILLAKIIRLDVNIIVPSTGLSNSGQLLKQLLQRIESSTVSMELYEVIRDDIVLALLRAFARARALDGFVTIWQQNMSEAIRVRYTSKDDPDTVPAVLVWDDEDVFDEFKSLALVHAPPTMSQRLLQELSEQLKGIAEKIGSTADAFAKLAVVSALLELSGTEDAGLNLPATHLSDLFQETMSALPRRSDYQAQRWRLWKAIRLLVSLLDLEKISGLESLMQPSYNFMSLDELEDSGKHDPTRKRAARFLECLECFTLVVELAVKQPQFQKKLASELNHLTELMMQSQTSAKSFALWNGRSFDCDSPSKLVAACIGRLLQRPEAFSSCSDALKDLIDKSLDLISSPGHSNTTSEDERNLAALMKALANAEEVINNPTLRETVLQHTAQSLESADGRLSQSQLQVIPLGAIKKPLLRKLAAATTSRLMGDPQNSTLQAIADDLNLVIQLDSVSSRTSIDCKEWTLWVELSEKLLSRKDIALSPFLWPVVHMLTTIVDRIFVQASAAQKSAVLSDIFTWTKKAIEAAQDSELHHSDFLALQVFFGHFCQGEEILDNIVTRQKLGKVQKGYLRLLKDRLDRAIRGLEDEKTLFELKLTLDAAHRIGDLARDEQIRQEVAGVQRMLQTATTSLGAKDEWRMRLSAQRECWELVPLPDSKPDEKQLEMSIQKLAASFDGVVWTNADVSLLLLDADIVVRQGGPAAWTHIFDFLHKQDKHPGFQLVRPVVIASIILHTTTQDILQHPDLAETLAGIACLQNLSLASTLEELVLTLENARTVLDTHPLVVNQATLDRLLASLCTVASAISDEHISISSPDTNTGPHAADIYDRLCAIVGSVLARHRRRVSDRYHLILPVLQTLLRCLFWPGSRGLHDTNGTTIAIGLGSFGQILPKWMRESPESLPPSSAEKFSRLLSSICNPTVSAARSSKRRGHNELNDETKRAKLLAGQHMQYLVMEYARCTLDGQISSLVKERLMPGMYSVMSAMERDLLRALNAGMDPSSRAIFKTLYDDWSRYGKWDKS
ncbi:hypothetical protein A1O1_06845 [Capronia coronata CBS 617.96]|uniref:Nucleolar 27S pre-rRNA processing Urb2/Npa2 C-terminal domain-containing protein n=1 Tax=Capronia coronata CBS 617.96 TaxID=1182541 RepID=W9Y1V7_9EURO|nr:uncharacterized protein A1O1_06845 [Capronia coronata CBS 617.96]EXJ83226.1 hypothetical protein A1O1_06845 [Capronia coronata CBS 617.96]